MSCSFQVGQDIVWWPASGTARMVLDLVGEIERTLGTPSGLHDTHADEVLLDVEALSRFLHVILERFESPDEPFAVLTEGVVVVLLGLLLRADERLARDLDCPKAWTRQANDFIARHGYRNDDESRVP